MIYIILYFLIISLVAVGLTVYDKNAAKNKKQRISEKSLLTVAFLGGAAAMFYTMKSIHHKTLHKKFMIGLPLIMVFHLIIIVLSYGLYNGYITI